MFTFVILPVKYGRAFRHARQLVGKPVPVIPGSAPRALASLRDAAPYKQFAVLIRRAGCPHPAAQNAKAPAISGGLRQATLRGARICPCRAVAHRADIVVRPYGTERRGRRPLQMTDFFGRLAGAPFGTPALLSLYFLKLSFRDTLRLNTRCSAELSRLSRQK